MDEAFWWILVEGLTRFLHWDVSSMKLWGKKLPDYNFLLPCTCIFALLPLPCSYLHSPLGGTKVHTKKTKIINSTTVTPSGEVADCNKLNILAFLHMAAVKH